ncbi:MAG: NAD-dependent epimerase/dehydratase family protein [Patescibacteria group bacterium]
MIVDGKKQKVVVTGGAGFIGRHLVAGLQGEGYEVALIDSKDGSTVCDTAALECAFAGARFVFHLAALPRVQFTIENPEESHNVNVNGTLSVLEAARRAKVERVVFASSSSVYGDPESLPMVETMSARPKSPYGLHKYIGERYCQLYSTIHGLSTVCLRYFNVYGPGGTTHETYPLVIPLFIEQLKSGKPMTITGDGTQTRDLTHVRDVVRANILAATGQGVGKGEVINIGAGRNISVNTIAKLIGGPTVYIAPRLEPHDTLADNSLAKQLLGWEPQISLEEGIEELKRLAQMP